MFCEFDSVRLLVHLFICSSICSSACPSVHLFVHLFLCSSIRSSVRPAVYSLVYLFICLTICSSVRPSALNVRFQNWLVTCLHDFRHKLRKVGRPNFLKKVPTVQESCEIPKKWPKIELLGVWQKSDSFVSTFLIWIWKY